MVRLLLIIGNSRFLIDGQSFGFIIGGKEQRNLTPINLKSMFIMEVRTVKCRILKIFLVIFSIFVPLATACATSPSGPYLFEQLRLPVYKKSFNAFFESQHNIEPWLEGYIKDRNGVDTPGETLTIDNTVYEYYHVCQPHNCPGNVIHVIFEPGGAHAWALFTKNDGTSRFFGNPSLQIQAILKSLIN